MKKLLSAVAVLTPLMGSARADSDDRVWDFPDQSPAQNVAPPPQAARLPQKRQRLKCEPQHAYVDGSLPRSAHQRLRHRR